MKVNLSDINQTFNGLHHHNDCSFDVNDGYSLTRIQVESFSWTNEYSLVQDVSYENLHLLMTSGHVQFRENDLNSLALPVLPEMHSTLLLPKLHTLFVMFFALNVRLRILMN